ncbi:MAG: hypothetical protein A3H69_00050 [Candidatus Sungbacteria bacterium RIFCSPLOWO2_02_FULL_47_9]|uniref:GHMP kinase n=1 Tax=Candidatus Sungbacteria bacterium RIFCSPHIGHO2_01_FULL_47_32 TaxID=1802264 RepID=A0A1G2K7H2_9BACT|nr:MAG: hypothetical protein A2633_04100 [Candidatus Sungbacteria bacterium RIFCSPHIGHO2_01_FULL_47_32]OGZ98022.1 MAG: hypothetical protein A3D57_02805 [Candidatus Sungbacteria bacterium RIFCSPHIGHO2_02_FULL_46_12]OHA05772.1 MAG: hypothetical protein A3A28_05565 [Candidatus Sungbacteria bacterium RIFCSPLOWO2_01_FULL_47_32]OHA12165.1 MAG: hypothetical protein A3H69_00050 [Candidatus Sungbacteria bacterium RIFCSPLOWO2_02_FULL_47_9]
MNIIRAEAPTRIDLAGGTLDIHPIFLFHQPALTINIAINIRAKVAIEPSEKTQIISQDQGVSAFWDDPRRISWEEHPRLELILRIIKSFNPTKGFKLTVNSEAPVGSGLGGSSVIAIALTAALARWLDVSFSQEELVDYAKSIETQTIKVPTGYQDYWGAVYGGVHSYEMGLNGKLKRTALGSDAFHRELERHIMLVYVGKPHFSGTNNWALFKQHIDGEKATVEFFERLKENALLMKEALQKESLENVADALNKDWNTRKTMLPTMTTPEIEKLVTETFKTGAFAARVCGAGGGGCTLLLVEPKKREETTALIQKMGMQILPAKISERGVSIEI